jgi:hypothetical protein
LDFETLNKKVEKVKEKKKKENETETKTKRLDHLSLQLM